MNERIFFWVIAAAIAIGHLLMFWWIARRYLRSRRSAGENREMSGPFSLTELETMHQKGLISREEFDTLRKTVVREMSGAADKKEQDADR